MYDTWYVLLSKKNKEWMVDVGNEWTRNEWTSSEWTSNEWKRNEWILIYNSSIRYESTFKDWAWNEWTRHEKVVNESLWMNVGEWMLMN